MTDEHNHAHAPDEDHPISKKLLERAAHFEEELVAGYEAVNKYDKTVTFFGSARLPEDNPHYKAAQELASMVCKEGYTVITGGGGGIMEAGNRGAKDSCDLSLGFNIELPFEQTLNPYVTDGVSFTYFASRKVSMYFSGEAYVFFAGGYGTLDEFFQILTLIQTHKRPAAPIICVGSDFWNPIEDMIKQSLLANETISPEDMDLYTITDDLNEALSLIKKAPTSDE